MILVSLHMDSAKPFGHHYAPMILLFCFIYTYLVMISWLFFDYLLETLQWALSKTWQMFPFRIILYHSLRSFCSLLWTTYPVILYSWLLKLYLLLSELCTVSCLLLRAFQPCVHTFRNVNLDIQSRNCDCELVISLLICLVVKC